ncbi:MAG: ABC transporter permease [Gemmataceae bacterium]
MSYALKTLWHERQRFLSGVLAVTFSALLIALQTGLLLGLFAITSLPIDRSQADLWVGGPEVVSVDLGRPIPESYLARVADQPEVLETEIYVQGFAYWRKPQGGNELCMIIGSRLDDNALGAMQVLTPEMRSKLSEPGAIIIDESELHRLGIKGIGSTTEILGQRVRVVDLVKGFRSLAGPYIFCSIQTARPLLRYQPTQTTYVLARCKSKEDARQVAARLRNQYETMSAFASDDFSIRSRWHWLTKTKAGVALGCAAALGLMVGAVVTSQTLFAATMASIREYAVLRALGIPRWRLVATVMAQSFWVGMAGVALSMPACFALARLAKLIDLPVDLPWWLLLGTATITLTMALASGVTALRSLRLVEPVMLLR